MKDAKQLLLALTEAFPVDTIHRHSVTVNGNKLVTVTVWLPFYSGMTPQPFILDDADLDKPIEQIIEEIKKLVPERR